jgi:hypothetical protein
VKGKKVFFMVMALATQGFISFSQTLTITGRVIDAFTREPIPYAFIAALNDTAFAFASSTGLYEIQISTRVTALTAVARGYQPVTISFRQVKGFQLNFELHSSAAVMQQEARRTGSDVIERYVSRIFQNREANNPVFNDFYSYRVYEKLQFELENVAEELKRNRLLKPFDFLLEQSDTVISNQSPSLPFFFTEAVSQVYHRNRPLQRREIVEGNRSAGVENLTLIQVLKDIYRHVAVYDDYINLFGKSFISPISKEGMKHYDYVVSDSSFIEGKKCYRIDFFSRHAYERTFNGHFWFHDTTFALQRITLTLGRQAQINFIDELAFVKVFTCLEPDRWVPSHEQLVVRFARKVNGMRITVRKSRHYSHHLINVPVHRNFFHKSSYVTLHPEVFDRSREFWNENRPESLTEKERRIFDLVDTLKTIPAFQVYVASIVVLFTGHVEYKKVDIGPYYHLVSHNDVEGIRVRIGGRTNDRFHTRWRLEGYGAYGFKDREWKYMGGLRYAIRRKPFIALGYQFRHDLVQPGLHDPIFRDEGFLVILFRRNPSDRLALMQGHKLYFESAFRNGIYLRAQYLNNFYQPRSIFFTTASENNRSAVSENLRLSEVNLLVRYSYQEKFFEKKHKRTSLGSDFPVYQLSIARGLDGFLHGHFNYTRIGLRLTHRLNLFPYGFLNYSLEGGWSNGTAPYPMLFVHRGNESWRYDYTAFNLMNHYEFYTDRYVSLSAVHHLDGWLWRRLPLLRKLDWRELLSARILWGYLNENNKNLMASPSPLSAIRDIPYIEAGTGLENVLRFFRIDVLWRLTYLESPGIKPNGIRLSAQLIF